MKDLFKYALQFGTVWFMLAFLFRPQFGPLQEQWDPLVASALAVGELVAMVGLFRLFFAGTSRLFDGLNRALQGASKFLMIPAMLVAISIVMVGFLIPGLVLSGVKTLWPAYCATRDFSETWAVGMMLMVCDQMLGYFSGVRLFLPRRELRSEADSQKNDE